MDKKEIRAVIKHYFLKGKTATQIQAELQEVHGTSTPLLSTNSFWVNKLKRGRTNTDDEACSGRPKTATNEEMVNKVRQNFLDVTIKEEGKSLTFDWYHEQSYSGKYLNFFATIQSIDIYEIADTGKNVSIKSPSLL
ncbi:hypothetical protein ALC60_14017 [Trachymyrmex zeteki]|uniref:Mos1 transposase HTH domain-containing protein n=1 Tax=Mycetomoellerius zeteki TaxID=64791 RepID=A0A151WGP4_9HYME|nr:hypothetical protein ALC60_14017 [Trachymyrmex zeteki]